MKEIVEPDVAQQFLASVGNSSATVSNRPQDNPTTEEILTYTLKSEILATVKDGAYSGMSRLLSVHSE